MRIRWLIVLIGINILLLLVDSTGVLDSLRGQVELALSPIQHATRSVYQEIDRNLQFIGTFNDVYNENAVLGEKVNELQQLEAINESLISENEALRMQLDVPISKTADYTVGHILGFVRGDTSIRFILDVGEDDGVMVNDAVVIGQSLIGKISAVTPHRSTVIPIISTESVIPAYVQNKDATRVNGVVQGEFNTGLVLTQFVRDEQLREGELVFTSGLDGNFPAGLLLGEVSHVTSAKTNVFQEALLQQLWEVGKLDTVFILSLGDTNS